jgi:DNA modification methylase
VSSKTVGNLVIKRVSLAKIKPAAYNPRVQLKPGDPEYSRLEKSIAEFGYVDPLIWNERTGNLVAGHQRLTILKAKGVKAADVSVVDLDATQERLLNLAHNKVKGRWDQEALAELLGELQAGGGDVALSGFDTDEIDRIVKEGNNLVEMLVQPERGEVAPITEDEAPDAANVPQRCAVGDLWALGNHRLLCGDSTKADDVERLMGGAKADLCFTSPPYGQQRDYTAEGKAKVSDWDGLMIGVFANLPMADDGQVLVNLGMIHREGEWIPYWDAWIEWMRTRGWRRFGWYVWDQGPGMPGDWAGRLAPSHEFVFHFNQKSIKPEKARECKHAGEKHGGKGMRGKDGVVGERSHGRAAVQDTAILDSVVRVNRQGASNDAGGHPAPYPVGLPAVFLKSWEGNVFEPFCGSGTTLIAAEQLGRRCFGIEISPKYCDVIIARWEKLTGKKAAKAK